MKFVGCELCKNSDNLPLGYYWKDKENRIAVECKCHKKWYLENQSKKLFKHYGFNEKYWDYNPRTYVGTKSIENKNRLLNYITQFVENPEVRKLLLYIYGANGTQKTSLVNFIGKQLIIEGFTVRYILMNNLIKLLQEETFDEDSKNKIKKLSETDLLIIDEAMDKSKLTLWKSGFQLSFIDTFIRDRIQSQNKGIIFVSNVHPDKISEQGLSISIQDFIQRECKINNTLLTFEDNYVACSGLEYNSKIGLF